MALNVTTVTKQILSINGKLELYKLYNINADILAFN